MVLRYPQLGHSKRTGSRASLLLHSTRREEVPPLVLRGIWGSLMHSGSSQRTSIPTTRRANTQSLGVTIGTMPLTQRHSRLCLVAVAWHLFSLPSRPLLLPDRTMVVLRSGHLTLLILVVTNSQCLKLMAADMAWRGKDLAALCPHITLPV